MESGLGPLIRRKIGADHVLNENLDNSHRSTHSQSIEIATQSKPCRLNNRCYLIFKNCVVVPDLHQRLCRSWLVFVLLGFLLTPTIRAQVPPLTRPPVGHLPNVNRASNLDDPSALSIGFSGGFVSATDEAFAATDYGFSASGFFGFAMAPLRELRFGFSFVDVPETVRPRRVRSAAVYLEPYMGTVVSGFVLRLAPRIGRMWEWRDIFVYSPLNGWGFGGSASILRPVSSRLSIETGASFTSYSFGPADIEGLPPDLDQQSQANVLEFRLGAVFRLKKGSPRVTEDEFDNWRR